MLLFLEAEGLTAGAGSIRSGAEPVPMGPRVGRAAGHTQGFTGHNWQSHLDSKPHAHLRVLVSFLLVVRL